MFVFYQIDDVLCGAVDAGDESVVLAGHGAPEHGALDEEVAGDAAFVVAFVVARTWKVGGCLWTSRSTGRLKE